jgi:hypothetical protein
VDGDVSARRKKDGFERAKAALQYNCWSRIKFPQFWLKCAIDLLAGERRETPEEMNRFDLRRGLSYEVVLHGTSAYKASIFRPDGSLKLLARILPKVYLRKLHRLVLRRLSQSEHGSRTLPQ